MNTYRKYNALEFDAFRATMRQGIWQCLLTDAVLAFIEDHKSGHQDGPITHPYENGKSDWICSNLPEERAREYGWESVDHIVDALAEVEGVAQPMRDWEMDDSDHPLWGVYNRVEEHLMTLDDTDPRFWFCFGGCDFLGPLYHDALCECMPHYDWRLRRSYRKNGGATGHTTIVSHRMGVIFDLFVPDVGEALKAAGVKGVAAA